MAERQGEPRTLAQAHESLAAWWPGSGAGPSALAEYYRQAAGVYAAVAEFDTWRPNETRWWAQESARLADQHAAQAEAVSPQGST
jgi:hypothetical protein